MQSSPTRETKKRSFRFPSLLMFVPRLSWKIHQSTSEIDTRTKPKQRIVVLFRQKHTAAWVSLAGRQLVPAREDTLTALVDAFHREGFVCQPCLDLLGSKVLSMRHLNVKPSVNGIVRAVAGTPVAHLQHIILYIIYAAVSIDRSIRSERTPIMQHDDDRSWDKDDAMLCTQKRRWAERAAWLSGACVYSGIVHTVGGLM